MNYQTRDRQCRAPTDSSYPIHSELFRRGAAQPGSQRPPSSLFQSKGPMTAVRNFATSQKSSDFFSLLTSQMRRLDENFSLELTDDTPLQQALNCLIQAIDVLESEKSSIGYMAEPSLQDSQNSLKEKEDQLKLTEAALLRDRQVLQSQKEKIKKLKEHYQAFESDLKLQKQELDENELAEQRKLEEIKEQLELEFENISETKRKVDKEAAELNSLKSKLEDYQQSLTLEKEKIDQDRSTIFEKNLELDKLKWTLETEKSQIEEKIAITLHIREKIDQELQEIEKQRSEILKLKIELQTSSLKNESKVFEEEKLSLSAERLALAEERERLLIEEEKFAQLVTQYENEYQGLVCEQQVVEKDKIAVMEEREAVDEAWDELEEKQGKIGDRGKDGTDYAAMIEELQGQMANYNSELEERERELEEKNLEIERREEEVEKKLEEIQNVEYSLLRAKHDLEELSLGTIPELENQSQHIQHILADLLQKRSEVDHGYNQLQAKIQEFEKNRSQSRNGDDINRMADELENRLKKIREREEELSALEDLLEKDKKENLSHALFLQHAQKEFEESCSKKETEIEGTTKKLEKLQIKLESAIDLMNAKETELLGMKEFIIEGRSKLCSPKSDLN